MTRAQAEEWAVTFHTRLGMLDAIPGRETPEEIALARKEADEAVKRMEAYEKTTKSVPQKTT